MFSVRTSHHRFKTNHQPTLHNKRKFLLNSQQSFFNTGKRLRQENQNVKENPNVEENHNVEVNQNNENLSKSTTTTTNDNTTKQDVGNKLFKKLKQPFDISGRRWWFSFDPNISLIRDVLNPSFFFTFQDSEGKYMDKVKYNSRIETWGFKPEIALRSQLGFIPKKTEKLSLNEIPETLTLKGGFDVNIGLIFLSRSTIEEFNIPVYMIGMSGLPGFGFGFTRLTKGKLQIEEKSRNTAKIADKKVVRGEANFVFWAILLPLLFLVLANYLILLVVEFGNLNEVDTTNTTTTIEDGESSYGNAKESESDSSDSEQDSPNQSE